LYDPHDYEKVSDMLNQSRNTCEPSELKDCSFGAMKSLPPNSSHSGSTSPLASGILAKQTTSSAVSPLKLGVLAPTNTRRIGNKLTIDLVKGWISSLCILGLRAAITVNLYS
jgi:hypothetical protein